MDAETCLTVPAEYRCSAVSTLCFKKSPHRVSKSRLRGKVKQQSASVCACSSAVA